MPASLRRFWIQITSDRKRFGVLCATIGVGLLLWARLIIVSQVPRTAMADQGKSAGASTEKGGKGATDKPDAKSSGKSAMKEQRVVDVRLWSLSERDPFVISPLHFPKVQTRPEVKQEAGKLPTEPAEDSSQKEALLLARLRESLGLVRLEAAMGNSMAVIDGKRYRVGDVLPAIGGKSQTGGGTGQGNAGGERVQFTLVEVRTRSVVLEFQGRRFELEMSLPGETSK